MHNGNFEEIVCLSLDLDGQIVLLNLFNVSETNIVVSNYYLNVMYCYEEKGRSALSMIQN